DPAQRLPCEARLRVVVEADRHVAAAMSDARPEGFGLLAADHVAHDVGAPPARVVHHAVEDVLGRGVDDQLRTEALAYEALLATSGDGGDLCTRGHAQLNRGCAERAGP